MGVKWGNLQVDWFIRPTLNACLYSFKKQPVSSRSSHFPKTLFSITIVSRSKRTTSYSNTFQTLLDICEWMVRTLTFDFSFLSLSLPGMQLWRWDSIRGVDRTQSGHTVDRPRPGQRTARGVGGGGWQRGPPPDEGTLAGANKTDSYFPWSESALSYSNHWPIPTAGRANLESTLEMSE